MIRTVFICLLLIYYWYFYASSLTRIEKPTTGMPSKAAAYNFKFDSKQPNHFRFVVNGKLVWEHTLPVNTFNFYQNKIVPIDPCHGKRDGKLIPATGQLLYEYSKNIASSPLKFKENSPFTVLQGDVFYFKCLNGHIQNLEMCPSGTTLVSGVCQPINACTDKPHKTLLSHSLKSKYILCLNGKENIMTCPDQHIFHHNRCELMRNLNHYCKMFPDMPFLLDEVTRMECQNGKPVFIVCQPKTRFFDKDYCEPDHCYGLPDDTKIPLPERKVKSFKFVPGYMTCQKGKIHETVECPQNWDDLLSYGDNLTFLPMVFDGDRCSIPTFCENVFSDDPDTVVPVHEFTKHVKNWNLSKLFDRKSGFACENNVRKRKIVPPDSFVSKKFKIEPACGPSMPEQLPLHGDIQHYYDCNSNTTVACPASTFFNGSTCVPDPKLAFQYNGLPLFHFDSLNSESWIESWDYAKHTVPICQDPESKYDSLYNICTHPDCSNYTFLSQIPEMVILLPHDEDRAKCKYYEAEKTLKKEPVDVKYHFWNQRIVDNEEEEDVCIPGQHLQTGNYIWNTTMYATCNMNQPFIFCPSAHSQRLNLSPDGQHFACQTPSSNTFVFSETDWTIFSSNEIKRILPLDVHGGPTYIRLNKGSNQQILPINGLDIAEGVRLNLLVSQPVLLEPRFRITHPPNVAYEYDDQHNEDVKLSTPGHGYLVKLKNFTDKPLTFPRYKTVHLVDSLNPHLLV